MKNRKTYVVILMAGIALSAIVHFKYRNDLASALKTFRHEQANETVLIIRNVESTLRTMYQSLRTIARLPGVRAIDRYPGFHQGIGSNGESTGFDKDARKTVQEVYNNLATNVAVSEVYIVPVDIEPDEIDPHTGKLQEPITTFDELIIGRHADQGEDDKDAPVELEEIEIYEYRLMKRQLTWMRENVPMIESITGLEYPAISGPEVVTCDNTHYSPSHPDDLDRSGFVYSVPFFGPDDKLKGCISSVMLTHILRDILPTGDYALINLTYGYFIDSHQAGQSKASAQYAKASEPDPELLYSEVRSLNIMDKGGAWILWAGKPNATYWSRSDVQNARHAAIAAHAGVWILSIGLCTLTFLIGRNRSLLLSRNLELEQRVRDRTAKLQRALKSAQAATRAKSDFLANMSHEIRTPMTAILGFAENLQDSSLSESDRLNCAHTIHRNGGHLLGLINDILDLSKIEVGKMTVERRDCQPCRIIAGVASLMRVWADAKGLPFKIEYIGAIPETIRSDATRLRQMLINLIGNAIKFTKIGGVRLITRFVDDGDKHYLQFDVVDTGRGLTQEQLAKLFQPFMQVDTSTTREFGGTGLGLTISKRFAELLGGDITVAATELDMGSTFRATVATGPLDGVRMLDDPMSATTVDPEGAAGIMKSPRGAAQAEACGSSRLDCRILLAEDGPDNQRLISFILKKAGADVTVKENGKLALDAALAARDEGNPFDVILMDMQMPVMDGYEATVLLRRKGYTAPIIALTAHAMASDREKCINAGCDDYATKPIDRTKLIALIKTHISSRETVISSQENTPDIRVGELANDDMIELSRGV